MIKNLTKNIFKQRQLFQQNLKPQRFNFTTIKDQEEIDAEKQFLEQQRQEKEQKKKDFEQNRLKFVFIAASLGGTMVGSCLSYLLSDSEKKDCETQDQKQEEKNNFLGFKGEWNPNWDNRHHIYEKEENLIELMKKNPNDEELQSKVVKQRGVRHITLVRHGQYVHAEEREDKKLTKLGQQQAQMLGKRLKQMGKFDKIYVSDMVRAKETCDIICKELQTKTPVIEDPMLAEGSPCDVSPAHKSINNYFKKHGVPDSQKRIEGAFEKYIHRMEDSTQDTHELYVIHSNVIRYFMTRALQFPVEGWLRMSSANCAVTQFSIMPNGDIDVTNFGDSGHLNKDQITFS